MIYTEIETICSALDITVEQMLVIMGYSDERTSLYRRKSTLKSGVEPLGAQAAAVARLLELLIEHNSSLAKKIVRQMLDEKNEK